MSTKKEINNKKPENKKPKKMRTVLIIIIVVLLCCAVSTCGMLGLLLLSGDGETDPNSYGDSTDGYSPDGNFDFETYLGYEVFEVEVSDNKQLNSQLFEFYDNLEDLKKYDDQMISAARIENTDLFFTNYEDFNKTASEMIYQAEAISRYLENDQEVGQNQSLITPVCAKERNSFWYKVPIIGALVKAKHQSIEMSRTGIYDYLKNDLESVDRQRFLDEYELDSIEDLRDASDTQVENLARDPELRAGIDWTKVSTDLGKQAVIATNEGYKIGASRSPVTTTGLQSGLRVVFDKDSDVDNPMPSGQQQVVYPVGEDLQQVDSGKDWNELSNDARREVINEIKRMIDDQDKNLMMGVKIDVNSTGKVNLPQGKYDVVTAADNSVPVVVNDIEVEDNKVTELKVQYQDISQYALDPEIAAQLGFQAEIEKIEYEASTCYDLRDVPFGRKWSAEECEENYQDCVENPYYYDDEYNSCIGRGGCWDIHHWSSINRSNCPIDSENNLDYSDVRLQDDYEYFGEGNREFCECIVECRVDHQKEKDCSGNLRTCCENID